MKKFVTSCLSFCLCFLFFATTTGFATDMYPTGFEKKNIEFQPGSGGMFCKNENGEVYFISPNEILAYDSSEKIAPPSLSSGRSMVDASFDDYKPVVMVEAYFKSYSKPSKGSGCFIGPTGILTCAHALYRKEVDEWAYKVYVYTDYKNENDYGKRYEVNQMFIGGEYSKTDLDDWGIVTIKEPSQRDYYGYKSTSDTSTLHGKNVVMAGYCDAPSGGYRTMDFVYSEGVITTREPTQRALPCIEIKGDSEKGMSGSPVLEGRYVRGIVIRNGYRGIDGELCMVTDMLVINPWLHNAINEHSGR